MVNEQQAEGWGCPGCRAPADPLPVSHQHHGETRVPGLDLLSPFSCSFCSASPFAVCGSPHAGGSPCRHLLPFPAPSPLGGLLGGAASERASLRRVNVVLPAQVFQAMSGRADGLFIKPCGIRCHHFPSVRLQPFVASQHKGRRCRPAHAAKALALPLPAGATAWGCLSPAATGAESRKGQGRSSTVNAVRMSLEIILCLSQESD